MTSSIIFDRAADYYDETRGFPPGEEKNAAAVMARAGQLDANSSVLEVGIGTGRIALPLAPLVRAVYGIDLSRAMLNRLIIKRADACIRVVEGDATHLPWGNQSFDAVIGVHIFHLIPTWQEALREVARVLKPGGRLITGFRSGDETRERPYERLLWDAWEQAIETPRLPNVGVSREKYESFAEDQGWRRVGEKQVHHYTVWHSPRTFLDRLERRVWSNLWRVPEDDYTRGLAAVRAAVQEYRIDLDQMFEGQSNFTAIAYLPPEV